MIVPRVIPCLDVTGGRVVKGVNFVDLRDAGDPIVADYDRAAWSAEAGARVAHDGGAYPLLGGGDVNLYSLFVERALRLVAPEGMVGLLVPSGIVADKGAAEFFQAVSGAGRLAAFLDFENRRPRLGLDPFFPDVDSRFKFGVLAVGGAARRFKKTDFAFFQDDPEAAESAAYGLSPRALATLNPNTGTAPVFRSRRDAALALAVHRRLPVLVRHGPPRQAVWPVRYATMFHMTNDSGKFRTSAELQGAGAYRVAANRWKKGQEEWLPLYEGKMLQAYDHRAASVTVNTANLHRPAQPSPTEPLQHQDPKWLPEPQFWVAKNDVDLPAGLEWVLGFRNVTAPTNVRTVVAALGPCAGYGNSVPVIVPHILNFRNDQSKNKIYLNRYIKRYAYWAPLLLANFNSLALDFICRQKLQGQNLNYFIIEQLPVVPRSSLVKNFGGERADRLIRRYVLELTYTAHDMAAFARDLGYAGPPFRWDEEERLRLRARLDALFFLLYGLDREAAAHILGTFPIVEREEVQQYQRFRSRDLILGYMAAFAAGDIISEIAA